MRSRVRLSAIVTSIALTGFPFVHCAQSKEPKKEATKIKENAYSEFRGHVRDRNTIEKTFILEWDKGSQTIVVAPGTQLYRHGQTAKLESVKAGDAARGLGQVAKGKLIASAVAFGAEGVELPPKLKIPISLTLPPDRQ